MPEDCRTEADDDCDGTPNGENTYGCTDFYADLDGDGFPGTAAACVRQMRTTPPRKPPIVMTSDRRSTRVRHHPTVALEDCDADSRVDTTTADHEIDIGVHNASGDHRTFRNGVLFLDATGDGVDDLVVGTASSAPRLIEGPLTNHADLTAPLAILPAESVGGGNISLFAAGPGWRRLGDMLQVTWGNLYYPSPIGVRAFSSARRGPSAMEDALWSIDEDTAIGDVRVLPASADEPAVLLMTMDGSPDVRVLDLSDVGTPPAELGVIVDPFVTGGEVTPVQRMDLDGDGVEEFLVQQSTSGFMTQHRWTGGGAVYRPQTILGVLERYSLDDPYDLEPVHVVYGWSSLRPGRGHRPVSMGMVTPTSSARRRPTFSARRVVRCGSSLRTAWPRGAPHHHDRGGCDSLRRCRGCGDLGPGNRRLDGDGGRV